MCKKAVPWEENVFRPFCSQRCQLLDLQGWFGEQYRIPQDESLDAEDSMGHKDDRVSDIENF